MRLTATILTGLLLAPLAALALSAGDSTAAEPRSSTATPCMDVLARCLKNIKSPTTSPEKREPSAPDEELPGNGLAQHAMLYVGEGLNTIFLVREGQVQWTYDTGKGGELDDVWMMSNGNILFSRQDFAAEITLDKKEVWRLNSPPNTEIHSLQPMGLDKVMVVQNAVPNPHILVINKKTGVTEVDKVVPVQNKHPHAPFRRGRITAKGTYLLSFLSGKVVEYDQDMKAIWSYAIPSPWAAIRLRNGNTLITSERPEITREVDPQGKTVWEFDLTRDVPAGIDFRKTQSCTRLANGNTIICSRGNRGKSCQLLEVTSGKKVVWALRDWSNLGPATAVQILDDPGVPENPGESEH
jgi:hypothetical protein